MFISQLHLPVVSGTIATETNSAVSPRTPPRHGFGDTGAPPAVKIGVTTGDNSPVGVTPNGFPNARRRTPFASPVVSGDRIVIAGSATTVSPKIHPRNSASKSSSQSPVLWSSQPCREIGTMSMFTPGGRGMPKIFVVLLFTDGPWNELTSNFKRKRVGWFGSGRSTTPRVVAPEAS